MTEADKMISGLPYNPGDPALVAARVRAQRLMLRYNNTTLEDEQLRRELLDSLLGAIGRGGAAIRTPFSVDYGSNVHLGEGVFLNYGCVLLDVCLIQIGDKTQIGPAVQIYTADHPRNPEERAAGLELGQPVSIGANVWIGGGAIILPGVTIGDDAIIAAGSVVTRDIAAGTTVKGNPARP